MGDHIWLNSYPSSVPHTVEMDVYQNINELLNDGYKKYAKEIAYHHMGVDMTYQEVQKKATIFASYLQAIGMQKGDRIALQMPNTLQYIISMFGALQAGMVIVNTNPLYTEREMLHQFSDSGAKVIVILSNFASKLQAILPKTSIEHVIVTDVGDMMSFPKKQIVNFVIRNVKKMVPNYFLPKSISFSKALSVGTQNNYKKVEVKKEDIAFLQYTSGTTGISKAAMLTHNNITSHILQLRGWVKPKINSSGEIIITALPIYHVFCLTVNCLLFFDLGGKNILITNPKDFPAFFKELKKHKFTVFTGVNTLFNAMMNYKDFGKIDFAQLKVTIGGGMAIQTSVASRWEKLTGTSLCEGYGLTETSPVVSCNPIDGTDQIGTIGLPVPNTEVKIFDDYMNEMPIGKRGELCVKGPQVMLGYWNRPDETNLTIVDGWLKTGDIALFQEDGFLKIVDRKKDMILVSGFNVYPNEVEDVVSMLPEVLEVGVIGVPCEKSNEKVKAVIVKKDATLTEEKVRNHCKEQLAGYKIPKIIVFSEKELPKSNVGKIIRRKIK